MAAKKPDLISDKAHEIRGFAETVDHAAKPRCRRKNDRRLVREVGAGAERHAIEMVGFQRSRRLEIKTREVNQHRPETPAK